MIIIIIITTILIVVIVDISPEQVALEHFEAVSRGAVHPP